MKLNQLISVLKGVFAGVAAAFGLSVGAAELPAGYREVEYIESSGGAYMCGVDIGKSSCRAKSSEHIDDVDLVSGGVDAGFCLSRMSSKGEDVVGDSGWTTGSSFSFDAARGKDDCRDDDGDDYLFRRRILKSKGK